MKMIRLNTVAHWYNGLKLRCMLVDDTVGIAITTNPTSSYLPLHFHHTQRWASAWFLQGPADMTAIHLLPPLSSDQIHEGGVSISWADQLILHQQHYLSLKSTLADVLLRIGSTRVTRLSLISAIIVHTIWTTLELASDSADSRVCFFRMWFALFSSHYSIIHHRTAWMLNWSASFCVASRFFSIVELIHCLHLENDRDKDNRGSSPILTLQSRIDLSNGQFRWFAFFRCLNV